MSQPVNANVDHIHMAENATNVESVIGSFHPARVANVMDTLIHVTHVQASV